VHTIAWPSRQCVYRTRPRAQSSPEPALAGRAKREPRRGRDESDNRTRDGRQSVDDDGRCCDSPPHDDGACHRCFGMRGPEATSESGSTSGDMEGWSERPRTTSEVSADPPGYVVKRS
jgi:hypothetical protein